MKEPADPPPGTRSGGGSRVLVILVALGVAVTGTVTVVRSFLGEATPASRVEMSENGPIAYLGEGPLGDSDVHNTDLFVVDPETGKRRNVSSSAVAELSPVWSPDGRRVVFVRGWIAANSWQWRLFVLTLDGTEPQLLRSCGQPGCELPLAWSPDSTRIALGESESVHVVDVSDGSDTDLCSWEGCGGGISDIQWSPDGRRVAFAAGAILPPVPFGYDFGYSIETAIYVADADGSSATKLTEGGCGAPDKLCLRDSKPVWSPDGSSIAFTRLAESQTAGIYVVDLATEAVHRHARCALDDGLPDCGPYPWPRGKPAARSVHEESAIEVVTPGSPVVKRIQTCQEDSCVDPGEVVVSPDGQSLAFLSEQYPPTIYTLGIADGVMRKVVEIGDLDYATDCCVLQWLPRSQETVALVNTRPQSPAAGDAG